jgi:hypothetical protein
MLDELYHNHNNQNIYKYSGLHRNKGGGISNKSQCNDPPHENNNSDHFVVTETSIIIDIKSIKL